jgi:hypothetical protein
MCLSLVQETTAKRGGIHLYMELSVVGSPLQWDRLGVKSPIQALCPLLLGLLSGQLVDLSGSIHMGDRGGEL